MVEWEEDEERNAFDILVVLLFKRCFHFCYLKEVIKSNQNFVFISHSQN